MSRRDLFVLLDPVYTGADRDRIQNYPDSFGSDPFLS